MGIAFVVLPTTTTGTDTGRSCQFGDQAPTRVHIQTEQILMCRFSNGNQSISACRIIVSGTLWEQQKKSEPARAIIPPVASRPVH